MGLLDFLKKIPTANELTGGFGEWLTKVYSKSMTDALVLHDILIDGADGYTSQIDLILIENKGVFVIEVKTFADAKIYGNTKKTNWYYYKGGKKYEIYSPLKQNKKHVDYLKDFLKDFGDVPVFSIITMICEDFKINGEFDGKTAVCSSLPTMKKALDILSKDKPVFLMKIKNNKFLILSKIISI